MCTDLWRSLVSSNSTKRVSVSLIFESHSWNTTLFSCGVSLLLWFALHFAHTVSLFHQTTGRPKIGQDAQRIVVFFPGHLGVHRLGLQHHEWHGLQFRFPPSRIDRSQRRGLAGDRGDHIFKPWHRLLGLGTPRHVLFLRNFGSHALL